MAKTKTTTDKAPAKSETNASDAKGSLTPLTDEKTRSRPRAPASARRGATIPVLAARGRSTRSATCATTRPRRFRRRPRPIPRRLLAGAWRLFEQRRPGAAEREFRAALELKPDMLDARVGIGMARLSAGNADGAKEELSVVIEAGEKQAAELRDAERQGRVHAPRGSAVHPRLPRRRLPRVRSGSLRRRGDRPRARVRDRRGHRRHRGAAHRRQGADEAGEAGRRRRRAGAGGEVGDRRQPRAARAWRWRTSCPAPRTRRAPR